MTAVVVAVIAILAGAFAVGRAVVSRPGTADPIRLKRGIALGVLDTRAGALAAADNYAAAGLTVSLDATQLRRFVGTVVAPAARGSFITAGQTAYQRTRVPAEAHVIGLAVAHRLQQYVGGVARVAVWALANRWDGGTVPGQYSVLVELSLRWSAGAWQIISERESLPGPVASLIAGDKRSRSTAAWGGALAGMSAPYYGGS